MFALLLQLGAEQDNYNVDVAITRHYECCYTECHLCSASFMLSIIYAQCHLCSEPFMLRAIYAQCHLWFASLMLSVIYAECHLS